MNSINIIQCGIGALRAEKSFGIGSAWHGNGFGIDRYFQSLNRALLLLYKWKQNRAILLISDKTYPSESHLVIGSTGKIFEVFFCPRISKDTKINDAEKLDFLLNLCGATTSQFTMLQLFRIVFLFDIFVVGGCCSISAQSLDHPRIYVSPSGERFTQTQFDSLKKANMGKPIAMKDVIEKSNFTEVTFEILVLHPGDMIRSKWINKPLPTFTLTDIAGRSISNESLKGRVSVLNLWSTTCAPCIEEMPYLSELQGKYARKGVVFLALAPEDKKTIERTIAGRNFTYTLVPDARTLFRLLGLEGYPFHLVLNEAGIIKAIYSGSRINTGTNLVELDDRLVQAIDDALKAK